MDTATDLRAVRLPEIILRTGLSRTSIYRLMVEGKFPRHRRLSHKVALWRLSDEVDAWIGRNVAGDDVRRHDKLALWRHEDLTPL